RDATVTGVQTCALPILLLACLVVLFVLSPLLARLPYGAGCAAVMALVLLVTVMLHAGVTAIAAEPPAELGRMLVLAALIGAGLRSEERRVGHGWRAGGW